MHPRIDGQTIKSIPAGSLDPEQNWTVPDSTYVQSWLGEARAKFREYRHARAIGKVMEAHTMQRIIRLVMRIDAEHAAADGLRQQRDDALAQVASLKEAARRLDEGRTEALAANRVLQGRVAAAQAQRVEALLRLGEAEEEIERLHDRAQANAQIMKGEQHLLTRALEHLKNIYLAANAADEDFNISGAQDPDV